MMTGSRRSDDAIDIYIPRWLWGLLGAMMVMVLSMGAGSVGWAWSVNATLIRLETKLGPALISLGKLADAVDGQERRLEELRREIMRDIETRYPPSWLLDRLERLEREHDYRPQSSPPRPAP